MATKKAAATKAKKMVSRFTGSTCNVCKHAIVSGQTIFWDPNTRKSWHEKCPTLEPEPVEVNGDVLRERLAQAEESLTTQLLIVEDWVLNQLSPRPADPCPHCNGTGYTVIKADCSDTMDYSDWQSFPVPCGSGAVLDWPKDENGYRDRYALPVVKIGGVLAQFDTKANCYQTPDVKINEAHIHAGRAIIHWDYEYRLLQDDAIQAFPAYKGTLDMIRWLKQDLQIQKGDIATVLNRHVAFTGRVIFIGDNDSTYYYGVKGEKRAVVLTDSGKKVGGRLETAVLAQGVRICSDPRM